MDPHKLDSIEAKLDALTLSVSNQASDIKLLAQKLELYDVAALKGAVDETQKDVAKLQVSVRVGAVVAGCVLVAVVGLVFHVFSGGTI